MSLFDLACQQCWAIQEEWLRRILALTNREDLDPDWARQIREDRLTRPSALAAQRGRPLDGARSARVRDGVAIIDVTGPIVRRADLFSDISGATAVEALSRDFDIARRDSLVEAILLVFDSPGGEVTGIGEFARMIASARTDKPVWAYVEGLGASAAYWLASAAEQVIIDDTAILGSIGVVMAVPDPAKRTSREIEIVSSQSPNKRPDVTTERGRQLLQTIVDDTAAVFITDVARNRTVSEETVMRDFGQGGVMVGKVAVVAGLADRLGSFEQTLQDIRQVAGKRRMRPRMAASQEDSTMKLSEAWRGFFRAAKEEGIELEADAPAEPTTTAARAQVAEPSPAEQTAQAARIAELERQLAAQRTAQIAQAATTFADAAVRDRRAYPAEHAALIALYTQAAQDDDRLMVAEGQQTRVALIEAQIAARPQHSLSSEIVASGQGGVLETAGADKPMTAERRQKLLSMTPLGQAVLKAERAKSA